MPLPRRALGALLPLLVSACAMGGARSEAPPGDDPSETSPAGITLAITSPDEGALLTTNTVEVSGTTNAAQVTVGGTTAEVVDGRFTATVDLGEGENTIVAQAEDRAAAVRVFVDSEDPVVEILSPTPGAYVIGGVLEIQGRVTDASLGEVTIGGEPLEVGADGTFTHRAEVAPGAHRVRVTARDRAGHVGSAFTTALVGEFAEPGATIPGAAGLHVGPRALDAIGDGIEPYLSSSHLRPLIMARNPIVSGVWGRVEALGETHARSIVNLTPRAGSLRIDVRLEDVRIPLKAYINLFPDLTGTAYADAATATVVATVNASGGRPVVTITSTDVAIEGLLVDVDGLWSWIDRNVVTAAVRGKIESSLDSLAATQIPPAVEGAIERIPLSHELTIMDEPARVSAAVETLRVTSGGLDGSFGIGVGALEPDPAFDWAPGSILLAEGGSALGAGDDVRAAMSLDLVNAAFHAGWSTGKLELFMRRPSVGGEPLTVGFLGLLAPGVRDLAAADAPVSLRIRPALPPVVQPGEDGALIVVANDIRVVAVAETEDADIELFEVSVAVRAPITVSTIDNAVSVALGDVAISVDPVSGAELPPPEELDRVLTELVGPLPESYTSLDGLTLPQLFGFAVTDYGAELDGGYLVFSGRLRAAP